MNPRFPSSTAISCRTPASRVPAPEASAARLPGARGPAAGILLAVLVGAAAVFAAGDFTRGVGIYPGDPAAFHGPVLVPDTTTYRNLALHRPATASSNYDYNLTAQLITDGIIDQRLPRWLVCSSSAEGILPRDKREHLVDAYPGTAIDLPAAGGWVQVEQAGRYDAPGVDRRDPDKGEGLKALRDRKWDVATDITPATSRARYPLPPTPAPNAAQYIYISHPFPLTPTTASRTRMRTASSPLCPTRRSRRSPNRPLVR